MSQLHINNHPIIDHQTMKDLITKIEREVINGDWKNPKNLRTIFSLIDLTSLEGNDTPEKIQNLCKKALNISTIYKECPTVAAICVFPIFTEVAHEVLKNSPINLATVADFPYGQGDALTKVFEAGLSSSVGADEIDLVISRSHLFSKNYASLHKEIAMVKKNLEKDTRLKIILETGELETLEDVKIASDIAIQAGADFIKTSTGKSKSGASFEAVYVMCKAIKEHYLATGKKIGIKPSGGISSVEEAYKYLLLIKNMLGEDWIVPQWMRFGASSLAGKVLDELYGGNAKDYFKIQGGY